MKHMDNSVIKTLNDLLGETEYLQKRFRVLTAIADLLSSSQDNLLSETVPNIGSHILTELMRTRRHMDAIHKRLNQIEREVDSW